MKNSIKLVLCFFLALGLAGCSKHSNSIEEESVLSSEEIEEESGSSEDEDDEEDSEDEKSDEKESESSSEKEEEEVKEEEVKEESEKQSETSGSESQTTTQQTTTPSTQQSTQSNTTVASTPTDPDSKIAQWVAANINGSMSTTQKVQKAIAYCQSFPYNYNINNYRDMLNNGSGECWANTDLMIQLCKQMGIAAGVRTRSNTLSYPDFHIDNYVVIDGVSYVVDVGHSNRSQVEFYQSKGYSYSVKGDGTIMITDYDSYCTNLSIPSTINGYTVSEIASYAFQYHFEMQSVTIPSTVTMIDTLAFRQCTSLNTVNLPSTTQVADQAFYCESVTMLGNTRLNIANGITQKTYLYY